MSSKKDSGFFSTEDEYNQRRAAQDNGEETDEIDYTKYFEDEDDGIDIFSKSSEMN